MKRQERIKSIEKSLTQVEELHSAAIVTRQKGWSDLNLLDAIYATNTAIVTIGYEMLEQMKYEMEKEDE